MKRTQAALDNVRVCRESEMDAKLRKFKEEGTSKLQLVMDFDHTVTAGKVLGENIGTWNLFDLLMPEDARRRHDEIYAKFRPKEISGEMTEDEAVAWWSGSLGLIVSSGINLGQAKEVFLSEIKARSGAKGLFDFCNDAKVPVVVLSAGVKQVIEMILEKYDLQADVVLATKLQTDSNGLVTGWDKKTLIHNLNKREMGHEEMSGLREKRPNAIVVGDDPADADMVSGEAIRIRVHDPRQGEEEDFETYTRRSYEAGFDLIVKDSLAPVLDLVKWLASPASRSR
jgi:HAD superfamily phosphoserine phosphatase-like hydrolase